MEITLVMTAEPATAAAANLVLARHRCLSRLSDSSVDWSKLQFLEAEALRRAIEQLGYVHDIPTLPVHDSLLVPTDAVEIAEDTLRAAYRQVCGGEVQTHVKI